MRALPPKPKIDLREFVNADGSIRKKRVSLGEINYNNSESIGSENGSEGVKANEERRGSENKVGNKLSSATPAAKGTVYTGSTDRASYNSAGSSLERSLGKTVGRSGVQSTDENPPQLPSRASYRRRVSLESTDLQLEKENSMVEANSEPNHETSHDHNWIHERNQNLDRDRDARRLSDADTRNYALKPLHVSMPLQTHSADHRSPPAIPASFLGKVRRILAASSQYVCVLVGTRATVFSWRSATKLWDTKEVVESAAFSSDGNDVWLGTKSGAIIVHAAGSGHLVHRLTKAHLRPVTVCSLTRHGMVTLSGDDGKSILWDTQQFKAEKIGRVSVKTAHAATGGFNSSMLWTSKDHQVSIYNPSGTTFLLSNTALPKRGANLGAVKSLAAFGDMAFFGQNDGMIAIFRGTEMVGVVNGGIYSITALAAPSAIELWAGTRSGDILVFSLQTQLDPANEGRLTLAATLLRQWRAHPARIEQIVLAERKSAVLSVDRTGSVCAWNATPSDVLPAVPSQSAGFAVHVLSYNVGNASPSTINIDDLQGEWTNKADIVAVGLQEVVDLENTSQNALRLVTTGDAALGTAHERWKQFFESMLLPHGYTLVCAQPLLGILLLVLVKRRHITETTEITTKVVRTGIGGTYGNKGGAHVAFRLGGMTWNFTTCHLAAGHTATLQRNRDAEQLVEATGLHADVSFLFGDTNYRISAAREQAEQLIKSNNWAELRRMDQLLSQKTKNPSFSLGRFEEGLLNFRPTYKYDVGSQYYDSSDKRRIPAWCDRILFRGKGVQILEYGSVDEIMVSDHRPVYGSYLVPQLVRN